MMVVRLVFRFYRLVISPAFQVAFGIQCRYDESCSTYTERMLQERGLLKGTALGLRRILSCNQWSSHG